uniref:Uncharacterized protein n=1 Tax=Anopheles atroparvus TaxID=41427 RepID=A0A182JKC7_ANOAO
METDLAYDVLADYSLQETPFYEAPTPAAAAGFNFYSESSNGYQQQPLSSQQQQQQQLHNRSPNHGGRRNVVAYDLSLTTSMLAGKMQLMNTGGGSAGSGGMNYPPDAMHHASSLSLNDQQNHPNHQQQSGMALVPTGVSSVQTGSLALPGGGGLAKPKKLKKSVSFLPTFVQGCDGDTGLVQLKQEPLDDGPIRNIQKVPSLSDLSDPEASLVVIQVAQDVFVVRLLQVQGGFTALEQIQVHAVRDRCMAEDLVEQKVAERHGQGLVVLPFSFQLVHDTVEVTEWVATAQRLDDLRDGAGVLRQECDGVRQEAIDAVVLQLHVREVRTVLDVPVLEQQEELAQLLHVLTALGVHTVGGIDLLHKRGVSGAHGRHHAAQLQQQLPVELANHVAVEFVQFVDFILRVDRECAEVRSELDQHIERRLLGAGELGQHGKQENFGKHFHFRLSGKLTLRCGCGKTCKLSAQ